MIRPPTPSEVLRSHGFNGSQKLDRLLPSKRFCNTVLEVGVDRRPAWRDYFLRAEIVTLDLDSDWSFAALYYRQYFDVILACCLLAELTQVLKADGLLLLDRSTL
jgi:hypothetical protein